uniref:Uncharacterized protein n=1 Tax=Knipowitschia caucasica TaxID=637954 RepID=A0AAV2JEF6_KNICA
MVPYLRLLGVAQTRPGSSEGLLYQQIFWSIKPQPASLWECQFTPLVRL